MAQTTRPGVVAITGGSSGIGRAAASLFARRGWRVAIIARGAPGLEAARTAIAADSSAGRVIAVAADVSDAAALRDAAVAVVAQLGPIDVWVNNAAVGVFAPFTAMSDAEFRRVTDVDYLGTVNGTRVALQHMRPRGRGVVINVGSALAYRGVPLQSAYCAAKFAIRGFTEAVRAELIGENSGVRLTMVHPPSVNTPFYSHATSHAAGLPRPPPPIYQPEIIADAIHFAATHRRRDVLVGGQTVQTALLSSLAPGLMDFLAGKIAPLAQTSHNPAIAAAHDPNLFTPTTRVSPVHGAFDAESLSTSAQFWATKRRNAIGPGIGVMALLFALGRLRGRP